MQDPMADLLKGRVRQGLKMCACHCSLCKLLRWEFCIERCCFFPHYIEYLYIK